MQKYIECENCKLMYDCERTYLGGCANGVAWEEPAPSSVYSGYARTVMHALSVVGARNDPKTEKNVENDKLLTKKISLKIMANKKEVCKMDKKKWCKDAFCKYWRYKAGIVKLQEELDGIEIPVPGGTDFSAVGSGNGENGEEKKVHAYIEERERLMSQIKAVKAKVETVRKTIAHFSVEEKAKGKGHKKYIECRFIKCMGYVRAAIECGIAERTGDFWFDEILAVAQAIAEVEGYFSKKVEKN